MARNSVYRGFVGLLGSGKTFSMVHDAIMEFRRSPFQLFTNLSLLRFPEAVYIEGVDDLPIVDNGLILLDEVGICMGARSWQDVDKDVLDALALTRKQGLRLWWSTHKVDHVDKMLRDKTDDITYCRRWNRYIFRYYCAPGDKRLGLLHPVKLDPELCELYDTTELISSKGGSLGRGAVMVPRTTALRRREPANAAKGGRAARPVLPLMRPDLPGDKLYSLRPEARPAYDWLNRTGNLDPSRGWAEQVRAECRRQAWLRIFGLGPDDAPLTCTPENPWLEGFDPMSVRRRALVRKQQEAAQLLADAEKGLFRLSTAQKQNALKLMRENT